jgi:Flp pilus assembly protein TadD
LGDLAALEGRLNEAVGHYQLALEVAPNLPEAHHNFGLTLVHLGRQAEAVAEFEIAVRLRPDYPAAINNLALARRGVVPTP